jgi:hypothetical protein
MDPTGTEAADAAIDAFPAAVKAAAYDGVGTPQYT